MNRPKFFVVFFAACVFVLCFVASSSAQSASPESLIDDWVKAWNSHDGKAFERLFTDDVIWVAGDGERTEGRIGKGLGELHTTGWGRETTVAPSSIKVRTLSPDVAVILFQGALVAQQEGKRIEAGRAMIFVAVKGSDGWRIAAGQITKTGPGPK